MSNIQAETNGEAEVFVLSPDLLEKLGINLCNIAPTVKQSNKCKRENNKHSSKNAPDSNHELISEDVSKLQDSSFLETASLMKKSVFLSPTFIPLVGDAIPGEVEIAKKVEQHTNLQATERNTEENDTENNHFNQEKVIHETDKEFANDTIFENKYTTKSRISKETDSLVNLVTCNGNGRYDVKSQVANDNCNNKINMKKNLDDVKSKLKCSELSGPLLDFPKCNYQSSEQVPHTYNNIYKESESIDTIPTSESLDCELETKKTAIVPVSMQRHEEYSLDRNVVADNSSIKIDNSELFINQIISKNNGQRFVTPANQSALDSHICNSVNIDIIKYSNSDESVDMELDNILHETEILSSASSINMMSNETDVIGNNEELNEPSQISPSIVLSGIGQDNIVKENDILIPLSPDLMDISNISQNLSDTQDININILYETFDENYIDNESKIVNVEQKRAISNLVSCGSEKENQSNGIDNYNQIESDETSEKELDDALRGIEILISMQSKSSKIKTVEKNKFNKESEEELCCVIQGNTINKTIVESDYVTKKTNSSLPLDLSHIIIEAKGSHIIIDHNGSIKKIVNNDGEKTNQGTVDSVSSHNFSPSKHNMYDNANVKNGTINEILLDSSKNSNLNPINKSNKLNGAEQYFTENSHDVIVQNNSNNYIEAKQLNMKNLKHESITYNRESIPDGNLSINNMQTVNNNIYQETSKEIMRNQYETKVQDKHLLTKDDNNVDVTCINNTNTESTVENKVQEIAKYLKQVCQNKKLFKSKVGFHTKSKMFIQGVEKPGGSDEHKVVFSKLKLDKTYKKKKKIQLNVASSFKDFSLNTRKQSIDNSSEINTCMEPAPFLKQQEFCLCGDFGKLTLDDYNNLYEHIHFRSNTSINCPVDTLFEIFSERPSLTPYEIRDYELEEAIYGECDSGHICWQKFEYQEEPNVSTKIKLHEKVDAVTKGCSDTDTSSQKSHSAETLQKNREAASISKASNIEGTVDNNDSDFSKEIDENLLTEIIIIEENTVASPSDVASIERELNTSLGTSSSENQSEVEIKKETRKNFHANEANMNSITAVPEIIEIGDKVKKKKRKAIKDFEEPPAKKNVIKEVKCGVCKQMFIEPDWENHISKVHYYIAWKDGQTIDFENLLLLKKLKQKLNTKGSLICTFCGFEFVKLTHFLKHVKRCFSRKGPKYDDDGNEGKEVPSTSKLITCGVCRLEITDPNWIEHISEKHQYLAWKDGEPPLDIADENKVRDHLLNLVKNNGPLICVECGLLRKYTAKTIKNFLSHVKKCNIKNTKESQIPHESKVQKIKIEKTVDKSTGVCKCAVCEKDVDVSNWLDHIFEQHSYLAWKSGEEALDFEDQSVLWQHLNDISKQAGGLKCSKCGLIRKYVKAYLQHLSSCDNQNETIGENVINKEKESQEVDEIDCSNTSGPQKRCSNSNDSRDISTASQEDIHKSSATCGVCGTVVEESSWIDHIGKEHNYIAWKSGDTPLDPEDDKSLWQPLYDIVTEKGKLVCSKCGIERKYPKSFLHHIRKCTGPVTNISFSDDKTKRDGRSSYVNVSGTEVKCGVCKEMIAGSSWIAHIQNAHNYIAWLDGETPLDKKDVIKEHLHKLVDELGSLVCVKCGTTRKYAKKFLDHVNECSGENETKIKNKVGKNIDETATCGACMEHMPINRWMRHIREKHNYVAWKTDQAPVNIQKQAQIEKRLRAIVDKIKELVCPKCGYKSGDVEKYLQHSKDCAGDPNYKGECSEVTDLEQKELYQCAICEEKIKYGSWKKHAVHKHYNVAWVHGDEPIDLNNPNLIAKILKDYMKNGKLVCNVCGIARTSGIGFFAHFVSCGLSEEESDKYKMTCTICDSKYLGIYKYHHMAQHTQQQQARERQERTRCLQALEPVSGPRRAAEKARLVIEETVRQSKYVCQSCSFATDVKEEMDTHRCTKRRKTSEDLDMSIEQEEESSDNEEDLVDESEESPETESEDEESDIEVIKRKHHESNNASSRITRIPFTIQNLNEYLSKNVKDNTNFYLTTETLFPQWTQCKYTIVQEKEVLENVPPMDESCQVYSKQNWQKYQRWQAVSEKDTTTIFAGYSIRQVLWLPSHLNVSEHHDRNFLAVSCHRGDDCPQHDVEDVQEYTTLVQIWDFKDFKESVPKMVMGLVIPFGTVWAMDWCPSGTRECLVKEDEGFVRMGLLAVACSNGMAYILSVPYPSTVVKSNSIFCKLEPVAQLKFTMKSDQPKCQATSICWSKQKGHSTVVVGYSDGITAYYDLNTESPLLKSKEKNMSIIYPYYEERLLNGCIADVDSFPIASGGAALGATSPAGSALVPLAGTRCASERSQLAAASAAFLPAWPSVLLAGEDLIPSSWPNELEYWGFGRRSGSAQAICGCEHCGLAVTYMAPFLRSMRPHHARSELYKTAIACIRSKQLGKKRKHNEDKIIATELFTYKDAIAKYGIEFKFVSRKSTPDLYKASISNHKELDPDRYPLSAVTSMAFCSSAKHHKQLAAATHSGLIFVFDV